MKWYILRHGETYYNLNNLHQAKITKSYLDLTGIAQAEKHGKTLKKLLSNEELGNFKFFSSPLSRAFHTCQIIQEALGINDFPEEEDLLSNRGKGHIDAIQKNQNLELKKWFLSKEEEEESGIESVKSVFLRTALFLKKYQNEENLILISHGGQCKSLIYSLKLIKDLNIKIDDFYNYIDNLNREEGDKLFLNMSLLLGKFDQNHFYFYNGDECARI